MTPAVSVIVLSWNGRPLLQRCLDGLAAQSYRDFEVVLVDNGSSDGTADYLRERYPWVRLVALPENAGFAGGNNRALAECRGRYLVTLNNDTEPEPGFLAALVQAVESGERIGMVAAKMLNFYLPGVIDSLGVRVAPNGLGQNIGCGEKDLGQYDRPGEVFGPCAGAALYRRSMIEEIGFFDESFFAYYEDLDLAWRARLAGWRAVTAPDAVVLHVHSATSGKMSPFTVYHVQRNKWFVLLKNWPLSLLLRRLPLIVAIDLASLLLALISGRAAAAVRARCAVLASLPSLLRARRRVAALTVVDRAEIGRWFTAGEGVLSTFRRKLRDRRP
jgi:GT2 family glycosyltransferase